MCLFSGREHSSERCTGVEKHTASFEDSWRKGMLGYVSSLFSCWLTGSMSPVWGKNMIEGLRGLMSTLRPPLVHETDGPYLMTPQSLHPICLIYKMIYSKIYFMTKASSEMKFTGAVQIQQPLYESLGWLYTHMNVMLAALALIRLFLCWSVALGLIWGIQLSAFHFVVLRVEAFLMCQQQFRVRTQSSRSVKHTEYWIWPVVEILSLHAEKKQTSLLIYYTGLMHNWIF